MKTTIISTIFFLLVTSILEVSGQRVRVGSKGGSSIRTNTSTRPKSNTGTKVTTSSVGRNASATKIPKFSAPTSTADKLARDIKTNGRAGRETRLRTLANDPKLGKADKGWIKQEINAKAQGNRSTIRVPPGKELAHKRGKEAAKGFSHAHSELQSKELHKIQHKYDNNGRKQTQNTSTP